MTPNAHTPQAHQNSPGAIKPQPNAIPMAVQRPNPAANQPGQAQQPAAPRPNQLGQPPSKLAYL